MGRGPHFLTNWKRPMDPDFSPHKTLAPLCLRRSQPDEGNGASGRRGYHRSRHGAIRTARPRRILSEKLIETVRDGRNPSLFDQAGGNSRPAPRPTPPTMRAGFDVEIDPETETIATLGSKRRAGQPRHGDHHTGRCDPVAEPELPDPPLRFYHRRGRPSGISRSGRGLISSPGWNARCAIASRRRPA